MINENKSLFHIYFRECKTSTRQSLKWLTCHWRAVHADESRETLAVPWLIHHHCRHPGRSGTVSEPLPPARAPFSCARNVVDSSLELFSPRFQRSSSSGKEESTRGVIVEAVVLVSTWVRRRGKQRGPRRNKRGPRRRRKERLQCSVCLAAIDVLILL